MKRFLTCLAVGCLLTVPNVWAQNAASSHDMAILELLQVMGLERTASAGATAMIDAMNQQNPSLVAYKDIISSWAEKHFTWEAMAPEFLKMYREAFTEQEVREMLAFYKSPTGKKALEKMPELMQKGAMLGTSIAQANEKELLQMIEARHKEIEAQKQKP